MVQGETNAVISPSLPSNNQGKYYETNSNNNNEINGEKKKKVGN